MNEEPLQPVTPDDERWEALARYMAGESPPAEAAELRRWLAEAPERAALLSALARSTQGLAFQAPVDLEVEAALAGVTARMSVADVRPIGDVVAEREPSRWRTIALRAAVLMFAVAGLAIWRAVQTDGDPAAASLTWATASGQTDAVTLPDGTTVLLGPLSRLVLQPGYGDTARRVELDGEALFDVQPDAARLFTVVAGAAEVVDLGTTFTVRSLEMEDVRVAVTAGAVRLRAVTSSPDTGVVLRAGDRGFVDGAGRVSAQPDSAGAADLAWTSGRLVFYDTPLERVATELRRWYGVELRVTDPALARRSITSTFAGDSIADVLEVIGLITGARIERRGDTAYVRPAPGAGAR